MIRIIALTCFISLLVAAVVEINGSQTVSERCGIIVYAGLVIIVTLLYLKFLKQKEKIS